MSSELEEVPQITVEDIRAAQKRIAGVACRTPLKPSQDLSQRLSKPVYLKLETAQATGAFKLRGAANAVLNLDEEARKRGVCTFSSGNHGRALAYVARETGVPAVICLSELVPAVKVEGIRSLGAEVVVSGPDQDIAERAAHELAEQRGLTYISPFDHPDVIAGQGTIALEILEQCPEVDTLVVQVSGGGLMGGIAIAARALKPEIRLLGVSQALGPGMYESLEAGRIVEVEESPTLADALQGGLGHGNRYTFELGRRFIDRILLLSEEQLGRAMSYAFHKEKLVLEGAGAAAIGALLEDEIQPYLGNTVVALCTGDNVAPETLLEQIRRFP